MQLQPLLLKLNELLNGRLFHIPDYQRAYSWETKQRNDLFGDIERVQTSDEDHFMATVVGIAKEKKRIIADEFTVVEIVDGQQRLTTIVILLKAIQRALNKEDKMEKKLSDELSELLVKQDDMNLLLLQTNHDLTHIFLNYIRDGIKPQEDAAMLADQNITDAIRESEAFVENWRKGGKSLIDLISIIRNRLWVLFHSVEDESIVYRVFEVLNSRGLDVSWIDKLKSQLMGLAYETGEAAGRDQAVKELRHIWQKIYRTIGKRKHLTAETLRFAGTLCPGADPSESPRSRPVSEEASVQRLVKYAGKSAKTIVDCAKWLQRVVEAEDRLLSNHRRRAVTEIVQARLVAIAVFLREFSSSDRETILDRWERISFRIYGLSRKDARTAVGDYTRLAWRIINEKLSIDDILLSLSQIGELYPVSEFDTSNCYEGWTEELRYLLYRYEEHLAEKAGEKLNEHQWNKIWGVESAKSVEHIKPQSSGVRYVHHLGNLMMLPPGINSKLKDKDPADKADTYRTCGLLDAIEVAKRITEGNWDEEAVNKRTQEIKAWIQDQWKN